MFKKLKITQRLNKLERENKELKEQLSSFKKEYKDNDIMICLRIKNNDKYLINHENCKDFIQSYFSDRMNNYNPYINDVLDKIHKSEHRINQSIRNDKDISCKLTHLWSKCDSRPFKKSLDELLSSSDSEEIVSMQYDPPRIRKQLTDENVRNLFEFLFEIF